MSKKANSHNVSATQTKTSVTQAMEDTINTINMPIYALGVSGNMLECTKCGFKVRGSGFTDSGFSLSADSQIYVVISTGLSADEG